MEASSRLTSSLNDALLEELLPTGQGRRTVLLGCDDQALAAVTDRLTVKDPPDVVLRSALTSVAPLTSECGLRPALAALRSPPDDLVILCACVLAASRMAPDDSHSTHAYYIRLCEVLGITPRDQWPAVAGFKRIPARFQALAEWADREDRGVLALPLNPTPELVGVPISQTLLRRVDRARLGALFDRYRVAIDLGRDPLRLLRTDPARHQLTAPAQRLLGRDDLDVPLRATLEATYAAWDGTVIDEHGRRLATGTLRLGLSPASATLNLSLPQFACTVELTGPDGQRVLVPASPAELTLPAGWLTFANSGPVVAETADGRLVRTLPGATMLFSGTDTGFWLTAAAPRDSRVIVLTCDAGLIARDWGHRLARVPLPHGWMLVCDVAAEELPEEFREPTSDWKAAGSDVALVGGLALEPGVWLIDHPPTLVSRLCEPVLVEARGIADDWRQLGELEPNEPFTLDILAHRPGTYTIAVAGREFTIELAQHGIRVGVGELGHRPSDQYLMRAGAVSGADAEPYDSPQPVVCGAGVDGGGDPTWVVPVTVRARATVHVVYRDGHVRVAAPSPQPQWARQAQLPEDGSWPIPDGDEAVWLCVQSRAHPRVIALRSEQVPETDEVLDLADLFADAPVIEHGVDGLARWRALVESARASDQEATSG